MSDFRLRFRGARSRAGESTAARALDEMAAEVRSLDEAAEKAARRIAESADGLRSSRDRQAEPAADPLADLAAALAARADAVRSECDQLSALLDRATRMFSDQGAGERGEVAAAAVAPSAASFAPEDALLAATRMAIAGSTRDEIEQRLRREFGLDDAGPVLGDVYGDPAAVAR